MIIVCEIIEEGGCKIDFWGELNIIFFLVDNVVVWLYYNLIVI